ncbi:MAG: DEAD/DEAH box helicase [Planctomycetaceae bacterium]|nr:DEAD/DEAH box helicase [Planctomycetaceae bacterium]
MTIQDESGVCITPAGRVLITSSPDEEASLGAALVEELVAAFEASSADGVLWLVARALDATLPPALVFWREFGQRYFRAVCQLGDDAVEKWDQVRSPENDEFEAMAAAAPPMRGLEYLSTPLLRRLWNELHARVVEQAHESAEGPAAYLRSISPVWRLLGRVTFHLAENKRDEARPFAFLATYTHRVSAGARLQHLPLGQALKEYAGANNQPRLTSLLEPVRRAGDSVPLVREMLDSRALFQPQAWSIGQAYRFLSEVPQLEAAGLVVRVPDWWNPRRPPRPQVQVRLGQKNPSSALSMDSLLDFSVEVALDGEALSAAERKEILASRDGLVLLRGKWVEVDRDRLHQALDHWKHLQAEHAKGVDFIQGMRLLAGASIDGAPEQDATPDWSRIVAGDWLRDTLQTLRAPGGVTSVTPGADLRATLRPYQADGVRWLWFLTRLGLGACLADDMGLGKTIQMIDLLLHLKREPGAHGRRPSLLIVPSSLIGNWKQELQKFGPTLDVFFAHRSECDAEALERVAQDPRASLAGFDLAITTYGFARRSDWLRKVAWRLVVLDEAQAIKNAASAQTKAVKKLDAAGRIVLTGTPVENHLGDLWSLFDFCNPGLLGTAAQFKKFVNRLNKQQDATAYGALRRLVRPYILRRLKTDPSIVPDLPAKTDMRTECGLSKKQAALYERAVDDLARRLKESDGMARRGLVLAVLMQLKQICNHPAQYLNQSAYPPDESGKFLRLEQICEPIVERQERALVFTQFQSVCEPLAAFLEGVFGRNGLVLHGKTPIAKRTQLVREFQDDRGPPFLVVSVKAGGSGLNLTAASHVIHFDRWWNPAVENQATDRAFRIGQKRNVLVHKFVCRGTVEERIDEMIRGKQELANRVLDEGAETKLTELSDDELLRFVSIDLNRATADE